jgi:hypothetical protein
MQALISEMKGFLIVWSKYCISVSDDDDDENKIEGNFLGKVGSTLTKSGLASLFPTGS